jgi:hypothetical protein
MAISQFEIDAITRKTVLLYNRLKSPEAITKVLNVSPEKVTIAFSGSFCYDCGGILNYIQDFAKDFKVFTDTFELIIGQTREKTHTSFEVDYKVKHQ